MMRPIIFQVPPASPGNLVAANDPNVGGQVNLSFNDNSASETGFMIQRSLEPAFTSPTTVAVGPSSKLNAANEGTSWGSAVTATDNPGSGTSSTESRQSIMAGREPCLNPVTPPS